MGVIEIMSGKQKRRERYKEDLIKRKERTKGENVEDERRKVNKWWDRAKKKNCRKRSERKNKIGKGRCYEKEEKKKRLRVKHIRNCSKKTKVIFGK